MTRKYVKFERDKDETKEFVADIEHKKTGENLGRIYFNSEWKKFVADFGDVYFDGVCLDEIAEYLKWLDICKKDGTLKENIEG